MLTSSEQNVAIAKSYRHAIMAALNCPTEGFFDGVVLGLNQHGGCFCIDMGPLPNLDCDQLNGDCCVMFGDWREFRIIEEVVGAEAGKLAVCAIEEQARGVPMAGHLREKTMGGWWPPPSGDGWWVMTTVVLTSARGDRAWFPSVDE